MARLVKFICLANSLKEGGRCLAGIELDANHNPVFSNGRPKWVRPVFNLPNSHGEVPNIITAPFHLLDIIELEITGHQPQGHQTENVTFAENSLRNAGRFDPQFLNALCDNRYSIFGNRGKALSTETIAGLDHSLLLVAVNEFRAVVKVNESRPGKSQTRMVFRHNGAEYDFPITDPVFIENIKADPGLLNNKKPVYLCLSLGSEWENWYYKLVAGVIY